jgi:asparagine synthetase B (glutamine-hydrolysing)
VYVRNCGSRGAPGGCEPRRLGAGALQHRGPDAQRTERCATDNVIADLAFARLAIVELSNARQPMSNEYGRNTMLFNAEIYNSPALGPNASAPVTDSASQWTAKSFSTCGNGGPSALDRLKGILLEPCLIRRQANCCWPAIR